MNVFLRKDHNGLLYDQDTASAYFGFKDVADIHFYQTIHQIDAVHSDHLIVGSTIDLQLLFDRFEIAYPILDYPERLRPFLGRKIWPSTLFTVINSNSWNIFIKPMKDPKRFVGTILTSTKDLVRLGGLVNDIDVWCSEVVPFHSEWRAYVANNRILGLYPYRGDWKLPPDIHIIEEAVQLYVNAPHGYAIDFGVTADSRTLLIEVNDGYGLANYGLNASLYANLLQRRWMELTYSSAVAIE